MADSYIIDGYNLIHALGMIQKQVNPGGLEEARRKLLVFLADRFGADSARVTVVFDAQHAPRRVARQQVAHGLHVHFAPKDQTADDWIEKLIADEPQPRRLVVVSNDHRLQTAARQRAARGWTHEALLDFLDAQPGAERKQVQDEKAADLSPEETKHWLEEFGSLESDPELKEFFDQDRFE